MYQIRSIAVFLLVTLYIKVEAAGCKQTLMGTDYTGTQNIAIDGRTCALWTESSYGDGDFPDATVTDAKNYCRNPNKEDNGLWCNIFKYEVLGISSYDKVYCYVPYCDLSLQEVGCKTTSQGMEYMGKLAVTVSGKPCQLWRVNTPHTIVDLAWQNNFPDGGIDQALNYCRNPDPDTNDVWCYTLDPDTRWEYCDVPMCVSTTMITHPTTKTTTETVPSQKTQTTPLVTTITQKYSTTKDQTTNGPSIGLTGSTEFSQNKGSTEFLQNTGSTEFSQNTGSITFSKETTESYMTTSTIKKSSSTLNSETTDSVSQTEISTKNGDGQIVSSKQPPDDTTIHEAYTMGKSSSKLPFIQSSTSQGEALADSTTRDLIPNKEHMSTVKNKNAENLSTQFFNVTNKGIQNDLKPTEEPLITLDDTTVEAAHAEVFGAFGMLLCLCALIMFALMDCDTYHKNLKMMKRNCRSRRKFRKRKIRVYRGR